MGVAPLAGLQAVVGNRLAEVVDGVAADVGGKPIQHRRQLQITGALHGAIHGVPVVVGVGVGAGEVVLHKEDADEDRRTAGHHRAVDQPEGLGADPAAEQQPTAHHRQVVEQQVASLLGAVPPAAVVAGHDLGPARAWALAQLPPGVGQEAPQARQQLHPRFDHQVEEAARKQHQRMAQPAVEGLAAVAVAGVGVHAHQG